MNGKYKILSLAAIPICSLSLLAALLVACQVAEPQSTPSKPDPAALQSITPTLPFPSSSITTVTKSIQLTTETLAGNGTQGLKDGPLSEAQFMSVHGGCVDPQSKEIYLLDQHRIRKLTRDAEVLTIAGSEHSGFRDGPARQALFHNLQSCVFDEKGNIFVLDHGNYRIRQLTPEGQVFTYLGSGNSGIDDGELLEATSLDLMDITFVDGYLTFTDSFRIRQVQGKQVITLNKSQINPVGPSQHFNPDSPEKIQNYNFGSINWLAEQEQGAFFVSDTHLRSLFLINSQHIVSKMKPEPNVHFLTDDNTFTGIPLDIFYLQKENKLILQFSSGLLILQNQGENLKIVSSIEFITDKKEAIQYQMSALVLVEKELFFYNPKEYNIQKIDLSSLF